MMDLYNNPSFRYRSQKMENAAMILAILALIGGSCLYLSLPCGSIAVILALLSKGSHRKCSKRARRAILIGIIGLVVSILVYSITFYNLFQTYGSWDGILRNYCDVYGLDYNSLFSAQ